MIFPITAHSRNTDWLLYLLFSLMLIDYLVSLYIYIALYIDSIIDTEARGLSHARSNMFLHFHYAY